MQTIIDPLDNALHLGKAETGCEAPCQRITGPVDPWADIDDIATEPAVSDVPAASELAMDVLGEQDVAELAWADVSIVIVPDNELTSVGEVEQQLGSRKGMSDGDGVTERFNGHGLDSRLG